MSAIYPIAKVGDVIRGSLLADRPDQIPLLLQSVINQVKKMGGKFFIENHWKDPKPLSKGYVGVHIKIRMPLPSKETNEAGAGDKTGLDIMKNKYILIELQLHIKEIMDGTKDCAKEIAHLLYKAPKETEENLSPEIISSSQLVYLTSMTRLLATTEELKKIKTTLCMVQAIAKVADRKMRHFLEAALLLGDNKIDGEWNERLQVVVPKDKKDKEAVVTLWMAAAKKINESLNLPEIDKDIQLKWTNTAKSVDELYANAKQIAPLFSEMCKTAANSQQQCSYNFGPENKHMMKERSSLLNKIKAKYEAKELKQFMHQLLKKIGKSLLEITESNSVHIKNLSTIQSLNFDHCYTVTDSDLSFLLGRLTALKSLDLSVCYAITDKGLASLAPFTGLQTLKLSQCKIKDLTILSSLIGLQILDLSCCLEDTDKGFSSLSRLTRLESLDLTHGEKLTDNGLARLSRLTSLQNLKLYGCKQITDKGVASLRYLNKLQTLDLHDCNQITDKGVVSLSHLTGLQWLNFTWCDRITDKGLASLSNLTSLQMLCLRHCWQITEKGMVTLGHLTALEIVKDDYDSD